MLTLHCTVTMLTYWSHLNCNLCVLVFAALRCIHSWWNEYNVMQCYGGEKDLLPLQCVKLQLSIPMFLVGRLHFLAAQWVAFRCRRDPNWLIELSVLISMTICFRNCQDLNMCKANFSLLLNMHSREWLYRYVSSGGKSVILDAESMILSC
jgi:hypothetical protein